MQFVFDDGVNRREVDVVLHDPDALVADLVSALTTGPPSGRGLVIGRRVVPADRRLDRAGIVQGAVIGLAPLDRLSAPPGPCDEPTDRPAPVAVLDVVGGPDAGRWLDLPPGPCTIGRVRSHLAVDDATVSASHARLDVSGDGVVTITDEQSLNGTWLDDEPVTGPAVLSHRQVVRLGASQLTVGPAPDDGRRRSSAAPVPPGTAGTVPFNRPPRPTPSSQPEPVDPPRPLAPARPANPVGIVAVVAPLVLGVVMVQLFDSVLYGLFALLSPVMVVGGALEARRRNRTSGRRDRQRYERELTAFAERLAGVAADERAERLERLPSLAEVVRRGTGASTRLWERRPGHDDFLHLRAGLGSVSWAPPVPGERRHFDPPVRTAVDAASLLRHAPVDIDLSGGGVVGVVGHRPAAVGLARSLLVQAATAHGPADLSIAVLVAPGRVADWDWAKWLPHTLDRTGNGQRRLADEPGHADELLRALLERAPTEPAGPDGRPPGPTLLLVLDDESLTEGRRSRARSILRGAAGPVAAIVVAGSDDRLPAACTTVVDMAAGDERAVVHAPATGERIADVMVCGVAERTAREAARALARFDDPEHDGAEAGVPAVVRLLPLLGLDPPAPDGVLGCWRQAGRQPGLVAPIGIAADGVLAIDLVGDGPHGLVAGTTGAGKSELLRSMVAALAAAYPPDLVTFLLLDFKGGSAFDVCARLPHTVGLVTDLDGHLAARTLRCLEAELRHRERRLRDARVDDVEAHRRLGSPDPLPRLVVVVDEFATLAAELPDFVDALVGIAQRGRSLGVHLVLATQRPSGAVSESIRANTNLRIALRMPNANDSRDVIDRPDAAAIARDQPGRALVRLGPGELVTVQAALSTGVATGGGRAPVEVRPFRFGRPATTAGPSPDRRGPGHQGAIDDDRRPRTDLSLLVDAIGDAARSTGSVPPRRPVVEPLPAEIDLDDVLSRRPVDPFGESGALVPFAVADLPDTQAQQVAGWVPADGNLLLVGVGGSGTTTALSSIALSLAASNRPDDLHLHVLDFGAGGLTALGRLPHTGAVIAANERERQHRLVRHLTEELTRRRPLADPRRSEPRLVVLIDGMAGLRAACDDAGPSGLFDDVVRLFSDGPDVGLHMVISADRAGSIATAISAVARQRLVFRLGERLDYALFGISMLDLPQLGPGGAMVADSSTVVQVGRPLPGLEEAVGRACRTTGRAIGRPPAVIGELPDEVDVSDLVAAARIEAHRWVLPLGIGDRSLAPTSLTLHPGDHAILAGPPRSGRTTALEAVAQLVQSVAHDVTLVAVAPARSRLSTRSGIHRVLPGDAGRPDIDAIGDLPGAVLMLVDDVELVEDDHGGFAALLARRRPDLHVVAAGRAEALRTMYGHWTRGLRASRTGVLLQPDPDLDGDLLGIRLPRRAPARLIRGRGYLVSDGDLELVQLATASHTASDTPRTSIDMKHIES